MILNVSSRCDIPAFYSKWFLNRLKEGFIDVRNPYYPNQVSRIIVDQNTVDAIIFCTKNPIPMLSHLEEIIYPYMFQVTLTPYFKDIEPNVPKKSDIIKAIKFLSKKIGKDRVILRYDPILINSIYTIDYHIKNFEKICYLLKDDIKTIIISFVDLKKNTCQNQQDMKIENMSLEQIHYLAQSFGQISKKYHLKIQMCAEKYNFKEYGFDINSCINNMMIYTLTRKEKRFKKSINRKDCHCLESVDIGVYNSCSHFCKYCYANYDEKKVIQNMEQHNPNSSLLIGELKENDFIKIRKI